MNIVLGGRPPPIDTVETGLAQSALAKVKLMHHFILYLYQCILLRFSENRISEKPALAKQIFNEN